jgi:ADP-ribose pyrophosphatase
VLSLPQVPHLQRDRGRAGADAIGVGDSIPKVVEGGLVYDGWLKVRLDKLRYQSGREGPITYIDHPGAVIVVPVDAEGRILFVRQYRHPAGRWMLELPAGTLDAGEAPEPCAARELQEEAGYKPGRIEKLGGFYLAPGYSSEYLHVFLATELTESKLQGDEDVVNVERLSLDEALGRITFGEIEDAKTVAGLFLYIQKLRK